MANSALSWTSVPSRPVYPEGRDGTGSGRDFKNGIVPTQATSVFAYLQISPTSFTVTSDDSGYSASQFDAVRVRDQDVASLVSSGSVVPRYAVSDANNGKGHFHEQRGRPRGQTYNFKIKINRNFFSPISNMMFEIRKEKVS